MSLGETASTISTVAKEAGVSIATVSRVINHPSLVADQTRQRVMRVIQERNFRISREAQWTRRRHRALRTGRIGFLVPDTPHRTSEVITEEMSRGIQRALSDKNVELVLCHFPYETDPLISMPKMLRENSIDGILVRPPPTRSTLVEFCRNRKAVVLGNAFSDLDIPCVVGDDYAGIRMVMDYLFELGHRRIAFVGNTLSSVLNLRRVQSYRAYLEERDIPYDEQLVKIIDAWVVNAEEGAQFCRKFLDELMSLESPPTAIAAGTDGFAANLLLTATEKGLKLPTDLSITGLGDQHYAPYTHPPLTTVHIDYRAMGEVGATQLLHLIEGASYSMQVLIRPTFVERRSCAVINKKV